MDALELKDYQGNRYTAVNIVDMGTSVQQIVLVKTGGGNPVFSIGYGPSPPGT